MQPRMGTARCWRAAGLASAVGCAALLAAACTPSRPPHAGPPKSPPVASAPAFPLRSLAARYLVIASAGNRRLDADFGRLHGPDGRDAGADRAALRDIAATERTFDQRLAAIAFPPGIENAARSLISQNESRAALTAAAAGLSSVSQIRAVEPFLTAANGPVEAAVKVIRSKLGLPPPSTS
jgi:hypothetical protein